jgi:hypothetical protein
VGIVPYYPNPYPTREGSAQYTYTFDGWTLSVCADADGQTAWIGASSGSVSVLNSSADDMAQQLHSRITRNLTQQEWTRYVGVSIPYMTFK